MSNPSDLLEPLRYKNLSEYSLEDIRAIGGGVFTQIDTIGHLELLDKIAKAYTSVHAPTYGQIVTGTATWEGDTVNSATQKTLSLSAPLQNEVVRYQAIEAQSSEAGLTCSVILFNTVENKGSIVATKDISVGTLGFNLLESYGELEITFPQVVKIDFSTSGASVDSKYNASSVRTQL